MERLTMKERRVMVKAFAGSTARQRRRRRGRFWTDSWRPRATSGTMQRGCSATRVGGCGWGRGWCCRGR